MDEYKEIIDKAENKKIQKGKLGKSVSSSLDLIEQNEPKTTLSPSEQNEPKTTLSPSEQIESGNINLPDSGFTKEEAEIGHNIPKAKPIGKSKKNAS